MIMSYIQPRLAGLRRVGPSLGVAIEHVRQVTSGSHRQALRNPVDGNRGFGSQLGGQPHLARMPHAPGCELLLSDAIGSQRLGDGSLPL